jgi:hypothetical protein
MIELSARLVPRHRRPDESRRLSTGENHGDPPAPPEFIETIGKLGNGRVAK